MNSKKNYATEILDNKIDRYFNMKKEKYNKQRMMMNDNIKKSNLNKNIVSLNSEISSENNANNTESVNLKELQSRVIKTTNSIKGKLRNERIMRRLTLSQVSEKTGIGVSTIKRIEKQTALNHEAIEKNFKGLSSDELDEIKAKTADKGNMTLFNLLKLQFFYNLNPMYLFTDTIYNDIENIGKYEELGLNDYSIRRLKYLAKSEKLKDKKALELVNFLLEYYNSSTVTDFLSLLTDYLFHSELANENGDSVEDSKYEKEANEINRIDKLIQSAKKMKSYDSLPRHMSKLLF
jgi:transcriptional regulator with XRE-family HTH domain